MPEERKVEKPVIKLIESERLGGAGVVREEIECRDRGMDWC